MPSFRSAKDQAVAAVSKKIALGQSRHDHKKDGKIHSVRTAQAYTQALKSFAGFIQQHRLGDLKSATADTAKMYLQERQESGLSQKTLDQDRQAIACHLGEKRDRVKSLEETKLAGRSYTPAQVQIIASNQNERNALATAICYAAGLRASELQTIRPTTENPASSHRAWSPDRFTGRAGIRYSVEGKGGLVREVLIPHDLAAKLESVRFKDGPRTVVDRGVFYEKHYDIGSGKTWSTSFSRVSGTQLGWSTGGHGLRHSYAQERMNELKQLAFSHKDALATVAQELGHFSPSTTEAYLR